MVLREMETVHGIPLGRLTWPAGITQSKYAAMIGNAFTAGVIGRVALQVLKTVRNCHQHTLITGQKKRCTFGDQA